MRWLCSIVVASLLQVVAAQPKLVELCALNSHSGYFQKYGCPWTASGDPAAITELCVVVTFARAVPCAASTEESACVRGVMDDAGFCGTRG